MGGYAGVPAGMQFFPQMGQMSVQMMLQQQFMNQYYQYCQMNGLNAQDQNVYNNYCQMWMLNNQKAMNPAGSFNVPNPGMNTNVFPNNVNNVNNNNNNSTNNGNNLNANSIYIHDDEDPNRPKEVVPRDAKTVYMQPNEVKTNSNQMQNFMSNMPNNQNFSQFQNLGGNFGNLAGLNNDVINVNLTSGTGFKIIIPAPKSMTFEDLFINFANKANFPTSAIGEQVVFLYNAEKLDPKSKNPISSLFKSAIANITVLDQGGIIGA